QRRAIEDQRTAIVDWKKLPPAEDCSVSERTNRFPFNFTAQDMGTVLDEQQMMFLAERLETPQGLGKAKVVHHQDRPRRASNFLFDIGKVWRAIAVDGIKVDVSTVRQHRLYSCLTDIRRH